jgi:hypothetical protein
VSTANFKAKLSKDSDISLQSKAEFFLQFGTFSEGIAVL